MFDESLNLLRGFLKNNGKIGHLICEMSKNLATVLHVRKCFENLKDKVIDSDIFQDKRLKTFRILEMYGDLRV